MNIFFMNYNLWGISFETVNNTFDFIKFRYSTFFNFKTKFSFR